MLPASKPGMCSRLAIQVLALEPIFLYYRQINKLTHGVTYGGVLLPKTPWSLTMSFSELSVSCKEEEGCKKDNSDFKALPELGRQEKHDLTPNPCLFEDNVWWYTAVDKAIGNSQENAIILKHKLLVKSAWNYRFHFNVNQRFILKYLISECIGEARFLLVCTLREIGELRALWTIENLQKSEKHKDCM